LARRLTGSHTPKADRPQINALLPRHFAGFRKIVRVAQAFTREYTLHAGGAGHICLN
jgi:hypothetical protein